ncbi:hypothetical protein [Aeromicrobium sp. A1-2]|uniref:hypothetical protein n=1 Tax=Aeromicrobium sp. A1-2 TaxID=2107713 RepID=UPI0020B120E4|nr:hypothetical protein [Aeromicrobium sp. A1-2]
MATYAAVPDGLGDDVAAAVPVATEAARRALDAVGVTRGSTVVIHGASGGVGALAVQQAVARGRRSSRLHRPGTTIGCAPSGRCRSRTTPVGPIAPPRSLRPGSMPSSTPQGEGCSPSRCAWSDRRTGS